MITVALLAMQVYAQHDEQVTVEGKYRPKVNRVDKLKLNPQTPVPTYVMPSTEVHPKEANQKFALDLEKLSPTAFASKDDKLVTPTKNFLMAGMGTRLSPVFLYKHNSMLTNTLGLGIGIKHNSSWLNMKDYAPSSYMNNAFDVNLTTSYFTGVQLNIGAYYKNDMFHYYGVNLVETPLTEEQIELFCPRHTYNTIGTHLGLASASTRLGELSHSGDLNYHYTFDNTYAREHFVDVAYGLGYTQKWWGDKSHPQKIGVDLAFQYEYFETSHLVAELPVAGRSDLFLFKVNPFFEMSGEFYKLHLGVRLDGVNRVQNEDKFLAVRPDVSGSLFVLNKKLEFYAGVNGGRKLTTYSGIINENPFVGCEYPLLAQNVKMGFDGGVRTNIAEIVDLHLGVRYRHTDNDALYNTDDYNIDYVFDYTQSDVVFNKFTLVYDEIRTVSVLADVRVKMRNSLTADVGFAYNNCNPANEEYAWYRPTTEGKLKLTYDLNDKLALHGSFLYQGGRYAKVVEFGHQGLTYSTQKLKDVLDLSLGADYKVNDQITAFGLLDNVLCQKYQLYYNYPVTGIQFYAGVKLKF